MSVWQSLSALVRTLLMMSLAGSILAVLLYVLQPLWKYKIPKRVQYGLWCLVLVTFLVPVSAFVSLPVATPLSPVQAVCDAHIKTTAEQREILAQKQYGMEYSALEPEAQVAISYEEIGLAKGGINDYLLMMLLLGGVLSFCFDIVQYAAYLAGLRRSRVAGTAHELALLQAFCPGQGCPSLYRSALAVTPMLLGVFRPAIYLPDRAYTDGQLGNILRHELMHWRRKDILMKWIATFAVHLHWFNPVIYLVRRELDRLCELACDEAVTSVLDRQGKQSYGDTLIEMAADSKSRRTIVSTTMCEEKQTLKERLEAIMKGSAHTKWAMFISGILVVLVLGLAIFLGASANQSSNVLDREGIAPYQLSEESQNLLQYLNLSDNSLILSFNGPAEAAVLEINVCRLHGEGWESVGGGAISLSEERDVAAQLDGILAMTMEENYAISFNVVLDGASYSFVSDELAPGEEILASTKKFLPEFQEIELGKEIPVALLVYADGRGMRNHSLQEYFEPQNFAGMELVQVVTLTFTK